MSAVKFPSLSDVLQQAGLSNKTGITFISGQESEDFLSYPELLSEAKFVLFNLLASGLVAGDELVLQIEDNRSFLVLFWACLLGGIIPVPLSTGGQDEHKQKVLSVWTVLYRPWLVTTDDQLQRVLEFARENNETQLGEALAGRALSLAKVLRKKEQQSVLPVITPENIAYIQYSSGSTGSPKGVVLTHANLLCNSGDIATRSQTGSGDRALSWMPLTHDMGMICFHLTALLADIDQYLLPTPLFVRRPSLWLMKASQHRVTQLYSPNFGYQYLLASYSREEFLTAGVDLSPVRIIYNGAEPIDAAVCRRFATELADFGLHVNAAYPGYGLAEASVAVTLPVPGEVLRVHYLDRSQLRNGQLVKTVDAEDPNAVSFVETGFPIEHCQLRIAGPTDSPLRDRMVGHIQIKGGNVTAGYYRLEAATRDVYTADGWLRTGDIGFVADGRLVITGREKNILIINGQNYYPHDIERVVLQLPGMEPGKVVACGLREPGESSDQLLLFILFKKPAAAFREVSAAVRQIVAEKTGLAVSLIIPVRKVPKTTSGKVQNFKLIEQYRQGEFNEVMHGLEAASGKGRGLAELWKKTTGLDLPGRRHSLLSEGVSSLGLMRFLTAVREETGKHITIRDLFEFPTIDGLEKLLVKAALDTPAGTCLVSGDGPLALTPTQRRFFFMEQLKPEGNPLGITYSFLLDGPLDVLKMREAVRLLRERHPVLGSFFRLTEEGPVQDFRPVSGDAFSYVESPSLIEAISRKAYDLESGDLFRVVGAKLENGQFQLSLMMHHLIGDGWTLTLLKKELLALYEGMPLAPALSPFGDYARWMAGYFESERYLADKQYWINQYEGFAFEPLFPVLSLEPGEHSSFSLSFAIGADRYTAIRRFTAEQQVSLLSVLLTAVTCWVYKYTGRADLPVTTDLHGRINPGLEAIAGCFINSLILRQLIRAEETPADLLQATHRQLLEAQAHQLYPADMALSHPLQEVVVLLQQFGEEAGDGSAEITQRVETSPAKLVIAFEEEAGGLTVRVDCQRRYFDEAQSRFLTGELNAALEGLVSRGREKLAGLDLLSAEEQQLLVNEYNQPVPVAEVDLIKVFEDRAEADPHADAVLFGDQVLSYAVLKEEVNKWANYLIEELSVGAGDRIGICLPRSEKTLILLLAVLKSGASYVLLDPEYPEERRQYMIADSGVRFVLDEEGYATAPVAAEMFPVADAAPAGVTGEAYVIYTSGTSGRPKGIPISRRALYDYVHVLSGELGFTAGDIVLQQSALSFDTLVEEVFPALYTGGTIHILAEGGRNVEAMLRAIEDGKATVLSTTPTVINELNKQAGRCEKLRVLISGGERMLYTQVDGLLQGNTIIYNSYGPSETTVCATYHRVKPGNGAVPIGRPLPNRVVYLLDADGNLAPWGAAGEIYIGGSGVSEGYVHLEEQTMSVFGDDKFMGAGRLYKTGDRARWRADGNLEFLGRKDRQVKIDGYRIETAEVEQRMAGYPGITAVAVLPRLVSGDRPVLAAYFSAAGEIHFPELRAWLLDTLPFYMVPSAWEQLEVLPSTVNGKIDLEALGALVLTGTETGVLDETEFVLLEGFREVLGQPEGLNKKSNFFALGGNSLMATRLLLWIQRRWKISLNLKAIFSHPTLEELAVYIRQAGTADTTASIPAVSGREFYPVSAGQRRLWLLEGFLGDKGAYNLNWAFEVSGGVDVDRLERAFSGLIARHEILRTNFCFRDGELFQVIHPDRKFAITVAETGGEIRRLISEQAVHPFDLEKDMLLRVVVAKMGAGRDLLILSMHHIITDAWSMDLLSAELSQAYNQMVPGEPAPAVQYKDFAVWQQAQLDSGAWDEHRRYWKQRFAGNVPVLPLAEDKPRPLVQTYNGRTIRIDIAENIKKPLARLAQDRSCSLFVVLLTAVKGFLSRITGETDLVIGTPVSGRVHPDISHQIGFFVNTLALRTTLRPGAGFEAMLDGVRADFLEAFEHQAYPFDRLVEDLQLVKDTSRNPLFSVMVDLLNTETARNQPLQLDGLELTTCPPESVTSQVDLSFDFKESGPGLALELNYNTDIYTDDRMQRMLDGFVVFLEDIGVNSGKPVSELTYLPASERAAVLSFGGSGLAATDAPDLVTLFESVVSRCGGRTAISAGNSECSYLQLNETANRLARCLTSRYKVTRGVRVGILAGRSEQTIAAVLAVLKAGAAYVPIDSALNAERIQYLIKDSGISLLLTDGPVTIAVPKTVAVLDLAAFRLVAPGYGSDNLEEKPNARDLVYLIYTSGSTGRPKGVKIGHRPLLGLWESLGQAYGLEEFPVRLLQIASFSFDVFFGDLLRSIFRGGTLVLCPDAVRYDLPALQQLLQKERISILESTPGLLLPLLDYLYEENKGIGALRLLIMGSDSLSVEDLRRVSSRFAGSGLRLINSYGTTETCIDACFFEVNGETLPAAGYVPIGRPLTNMRIYVLDDKQGLCAVGVRGEICIGGYGIGEGYWDRDQLTKQRFIANPYAPGERMYRTGDMGSWTNAGVLEYHGRTDFQVKIRGYRVEIGEVESVLQGYAGVKEVVVLAQEMGRNDRQLVGYIVWAGTADGSLLADESGLREYCRQQLPLYMHPAHFVTLERLPLTGNGKIDRLCLPKVEAQENVNYEGARTTTEASLIRIWEEVLERDGIGIRDNFFMLGGHSLKGIRLLWKIRKELGAELSFRDLFSHAELSEQATLIDGKESAVELPALKPAPPADSYPLSHAQRRLWLLDRLEGAGQLYTMPAAYRVPGDWETDRLEAALNGLIARHEILRTVIDMKDGEPVQQVLAEGRIRLHYETVDAGTLEARLRLDRERTFDLSVFPLLSFALYRVGPDEQVLSLNMHHIISDEWSAELMVSELNDLYEGRQLTAPQLQYKDYSVWQQQLLAGGWMAKAEQYWLEQFATGIPVLELPEDHRRPAIRSGRGASVRVQLDKAIVSGLEALSRSQGASLYMTLLATVKGLFYRYSGQNDIVIGSPVAGRSREELSDQLGFYVNTLALRTQFDGEASFRELLAKVQQTVLSGLEHQGYPFDGLVEKLKIERDLSRSPLFDVMVVLENTTTGWEEIPAENAISKFDWTLLFRPAGEEMTLEIEYNTDIFSRERIERLAAHYKGFLAAVLRDSEQALAAVDYLDENEKAELETFSGPAMSDYPRDSNLSQLFAQQARRACDVPAVVFGSRVMSYGELQHESDQLCQYLRQVYGVRRDDRVGLMLERSDKLIISLLGILKAGAAYVPIDPSYPAERIDYMLADASPRVVITEMPKAIGSLDYTVMDAGEEWELLSWYDGTVVPDCNGDTLAYIIYTSGSTGQPKGAMVAHHSVINLCAWLDETIYSREVSPQTAMLTASINFDASVQQLFAPLLSGSKLVLINETDRRDISRYIAQLKKHRVSVLDITPGYLRILLETLQSQGTEGIALRYVLVGGEALTAEDRAAFHTVLGTEVQLINVYGVTEATVDSAWEIVSPGTVHQTASIGRPLKNTRLYVLDSRQGLCGIGVRGELCIGGVGVGEGYWGREELTEERFIANPYAPGERLYRTGDRACWTNAGVLEYHGRADFQVKIRGHRIEPGEVESVLQGYAGVKEVVVLAQEMGRNDRQLVGYIVWAGTADGSLLADESGLREYCRQQLPLYMHPAHFVTLERLPLTGNGKIDRLRLPKVESQENVNYEGARTTTEASLIRIWEEVLERDGIGIRDNFFMLGGHSLKGIRLLWKIRKELGTELSFRDLFSHAELSEQATLIDGKESAVELPALKPAPPADSYPLSHAQRRLWLLDRLEGAGQLYTMPAAYRVPGDWETDRLEAALNGLIARHEILRTVIDMKDGEPVQQVLAEGRIRLHYETVDAGTLEARLRLDRERTFDLSVFPLLSFALYRVGPDEQVLSLNMHHIISDEWSAELMVSELNDLYEGRQLTAPQLQYKDYSVWQQQLLAGGWMAKAEQYWLEQFAGGIPVLELPEDYRRPAIRSGRGASVRVQLDKAIVSGLEALSRSQGASLYMTLLATVKGLLYRYSGQNDIVIGSPVAGRSREELSDQLGFYVNTLALRTQFDGEASFLALLAKVQQTVLSGLEHQDYPFDGLVEKLKIERDLSRSPLFDVMVVLENTTTGWEEIPAENAISKFDWTLLFRPAGEEMTLEIEYNTDIFSRERIERLAAHYKGFLAAVLRDSEQALAAVDYLDENEKAELETFSGPATSDYPRAGGVPQLFAQRARIMANSPAVVFGSRVMSYGELQHESDQLCQYLQQTYGVRGGDLVGLMLERSDKLIVSLLGILKAGAAYVPIDPSYPAERIDYMLADASPRVVIAESARATDYPVMDVSQEWDLLSFYEGTVVPEADADSLAYIIYTSGSTGQPKGVMVPHRGITRLVIDPNYVRLSYNERLLLTGSISFDASTFEIWGMLLNGGILYLLSTDELLDNEKLGRTIRDNKITTMWFSAPWFNQLTDQAPVVFAGLKQLLVGGDKLSPKHIHRVMTLYPDLRLINGYGPTENTTFSICHTINAIPATPGREANAIPLGRPISGTGVYILDKRLQQVPAGIRGEIYLSGDGLATGYLHLPERTAEVFIDYPSRPGVRIYRTGDLGAWNYAGNVEFFGRTDDQVKIRGFRIEPGEIESVLQGYAGLKEAVVLPFVTPWGEKELAAYLVWEKDENEKTLRAWLRGKLPAYMHPAYMVSLDRMPLNANGKINRQALPLPSFDREAAINRPLDQRETKLLAIWSDILQRSDLQPSDNFFEKGGQSLKASALMARVHKEFGVRLSMKALFLYPTIETLATAIAEEAPAGFTALEKVPEQPWYPLSHAQKRLWIIDQLEKGSGAYNIPVAYTLEGEIDKIRLEEALNRLVERHESLRTIFGQEDAAPVQKILPPGTTAVTLAVVDEDILDEQLQQAFYTPFELGRWPLFRSLLIRQREGRYIFVFCIHHIISDGWSQGIIARELSSIYNRQGDTAAPALQYRDYSEWHNRLLEGAFGQEAGDYWRGLFREPVTALDLPADRLRPRLQTFDGDTVHIDFGEALTRELTAFSQHQEATLFMSLLAMVNVLLYRYTRVEDIVITSPVAAREHADLHGLVGFFANTLPIRTRFAAGALFTQLLEAVKQNLLGAYRYQMYPYDKLIDEAGQSYDASHAPLSDVMVVLQSNDTGGLDLRDISAKVLERTTDTARFDLVFIFTIENGALQLDLGFNNTIYLRKRIIDMGSALQNMLRQADSLTGLTVEQLSFTGVPTIHDQKQYLLDERLKPVAEGVPGRLYFSFSDEQLRIESLKDISRYTVSPFGEGQFIYRTGDMAVYDPGNGLVYKGRERDYAQTNGHTVYRRQLEAAIGILPDVAAVYALVLNGQAPQLFIVPDASTAGMIRRMLRRRMDYPGGIHEAAVMPNGLPMYYKNKTEADFTYTEVFEQHSYVKNGITLYPGDIIFDVGANVGMFSLYAGYHFPGAKIFAFEPIPPVFDYLEANAALHELGIVPLNMGLAAEEGSAEFVYYPNNTIISGRFGDITEDKAVVRRYLRNLSESEEDISENHIEAILDEMVRTEAWTCRLSTLSQVKRDYSVDRIDLLKIDVEKSEWEILMGIADSDWKKIRQIIVEVHDLDGRLQQVQDLLAEHGFSVVVEQEKELAGTALYNLYAISTTMAAGGEAVTPKMQERPKWTDIDAYRSAITEAVGSRLPAWLGTPLIHLTESLPLDSDGEPDTAKIDRIRKFGDPLPNQQKEGERLVLYTTATFTAEPLKDYLGWWMKQLNIPVDLSFAGYNQVFQELLSEDSRLSRNTGINLLLVRWEDWLRAGQGTEEQQMTLIGNSLQQLLQILEAKDKKALYLVSILPLTGTAEFSPRLIEFLVDVNRRWKEALSGMPQVRVMDWSDIAADYSLPALYDAQRDRLGHIPFREEAYAAMATAVARQVKAYRQPARKLIVLDCDNTLWAGVVGEDGAEGVQVGPAHAALQIFLKEKLQAGFLLALNSKNNEAEVWEVFDKHPGMLLKKEDIVSWRINWQDKPANIRELVQELNIGIDSCCFIDDSPVECAAVSAACPEALVWQVPATAREMSFQLKHLWGLDKFTITEEDSRRTSLYRAEQQRMSLMENRPSMDSFLSQLGLEVSMQDVAGADIARIAQLTERTNQFNSNGRRRTETEIRAYMGDVSYRCWSVRVRDRFGDYGLTGAVIARENEGVLQVENFLLSCRVLGRQVERAILNGLRRQAREAGCTCIAMNFIDTGRNKPFREMLDSADCSSLVEEELPFIACYYNTPLPAVVTTEAGMAGADKAVETEQKLQLVFDHVGIAVHDTATALPFYEALGFIAGEEIYDPIQNVKIVMARAAEGGGVELIAPNNAYSPVNGILSTIGEQPYHFCYRVRTLNALFEGLQQEGLSYEIVKQPEKAVLFGGKLVVFLNIAQMGLMEFIEDGELDGLPAWQLPAAMETEFVTFDLRPGLHFFRMLGFRETDQQTDHLLQTYTVTMRSPGGMIVRLTRAGTGSQGEKAAFLQKNGVYLFGLSVAGEQQQIGEETADTPPPAHADVQTLALYYSSAGRLLRMPLYELQPQAAEQQGWQQPETDTEKAVCRIWTEVLRHSAFGRTTSFLEVGGNSIKATQVLSRIYKQYGVELLLTEFFNRPTIQALAALIGRQEPNHYAAIPMAPASSDYPLSFAQQQLWVSDQLAVGSGSVFNIPVAYTIEGVVDRVALEEAFQRLVGRHEILRTVFIGGADGPRQRVLPADEVRIEPEWIDFSNAVEPVADEEAAAPFELDKGPLLRLKIITTGVNRHLLLLTTHHIISDGWSAGILLKEVVAFYNAARSGKTLPLAPLKLQYKDFAVWQREQLGKPAFAEHRNFWLRKFQDGAPALQLPYDFPRPAFKSFEGKTLSFGLGQTLSASIKKTAEELDISLFMFFTGATLLLLHRFSGQTDLTIGFPISGRQHPDLEDQVGCYVNTLALRMPVDAGLRIRDFLQSVKQEMTRVYAHAAYPFERLVEDLGGHADLSRAPLFDVMVQMQDAHLVHEQDADSLDGLEIRLFDQPLRFSKYDLTVNVMETGNDIHVDLEYSSRLFHEETVTLMRLSFLQLLTVLAGTETKTVSELRVSAGEHQAHLHQQLQQDIISSIDEEF